MKTLRLFACLSFSIIGTAAAQVKLWSWTPTTKASFRTLHAISMAEDGSAAFVIGETQNGIWGSNDNPESNYLIVWVNPRGKVLLSKEVETSNTGTEVQLLEKETHWTISFFGSSKLAVSDGLSLRVFRNDRGAIKLKTTDISDSEVQTTHIFFGREAATGGVFLGKEETSGWIERQTVSAGALVIAIPDESGMPKNRRFSLWDIRSISAWRF